MPGVLNVVRSRLHHRKGVGPLPPPAHRPKTAAPLPLAPPQPQPDAAPLLRHLVEDLPLRPQDASLGYQLRVLPNLLATCFPVDNVDVDMGDVTAYRCISYALRQVQARGLQSGLRRGVGRRIDELERAAQLAFDLLGSKPLPYLVSKHLLVPLRANQAALVPGGFFAQEGGKADGHAVALYFVPNPRAGTTRIALCNRQDSNFHALDWRMRPIPTLWEVRTQALLHPCVAPLLGRIFEMQRPAPGHNLSAFYEAVYELLMACDGNVIGGRDEHRERDTVVMQPQTSQKGGTCSWHSAWSYLQVALQLDLCDSQRGPRALTPRRARNFYKYLKRQARAEVVSSAVQAYEAMPQGAPSEALKTQLVRARQWLLRHLMGDPSLLSLYSDVFFALKKA